MPVYLSCSFLCLSNPFHPLKKIHISNIWISVIRGIQAGCLSLAWQKKKKKRKKKERKEKKKKDVELYVQTFKLNSFILAMNFFHTDTTFEGRGEGGGEIIILKGNNWFC